MIAYEQALAALEEGGGVLRDLLAVTPELLGRLRARAQYFYDLRDDARARAVLEVLDLLEPDDRDITIMLVHVLTRLGCSRQAEDKLAPLLAGAPEAPEVRIAQAKLLLARGELAAAAELVRHLPGLD